MQIWYPINKDEIIPSKYLDNAKKRIKPISDQFEIVNVSPKLISLLLSDIKDINTNSELNANIDSIITMQKYPLLLFSHGLGGMRMQNTINPSWRIS